jgi:hypothetical protein
MHLLTTYRNQTLGQQIAFMYCIPVIISSLYDSYGIQSLISIYDKLHL